MNIDELARSAGAELREWEPSERRWEPPSVSNDARKRRDWRGLVAAAAAVVLLAGGALVATGIGESDNTEQIATSDETVAGDETVIIPFSCAVVPDVTGGVSTSDAEALESLPYVAGWELAADGPNGIDLSNSGLIAVTGTLEVVAPSTATSEAAVFAASVFEAAALEVNGCVSSVGTYTRSGPSPSVTSTFWCRVPVEWDAPGTRFGVDNEFLDALEADQTVSAWAAPRYFSALDGYGMVLITATTGDSGALPGIPPSVAAAVDAFVVQGFAESECSTTGTGGLSLDAEPRFAELAATLLSQVVDATAELDAEAFDAWLDEHLDSELDALGANVSDAWLWRSFLLSNRSN